MPYEMIFRAIVFIFEIYLQIYLINRLSNGSRRLHTVWIVLLLLSLQLFKLLCFESRLAKTVFSVFADSWLISFLYRDKITRILIHTAVFYAMMLLCDGIALIVLSLIQQRHMDFWEAFKDIHLYAVTSRLILPFFCFFYLKFWPRNRDQNNTLFLYPLPLCVIAALSH